MSGSLFTRLDAHDRALFVRVAAWRLESRNARILWRALTHLGGITASVAAAVIPLFVPRATHAASQALVTLAISHALVQLVKRTVGRPRPSMHDRGALVATPDRFSFPSGHSAASMSVAFIYAMAWPALAFPLLLLATLVGASRVRLGVHYPGDVLAGQFLAIVTGVVLLSL